MNETSHIMVTGGAGMIGSNLTRRLVGLGHRVSVVDNLWRGRKEYLLDEEGAPVIDFDCDFHELDLAVPGQLDGLLDGVDYVFHLADVVAGIDFVFAHQGYVFRQNLLINSNVIESARRHLVVEPHPRSLFVSLRYCKAHVESPLSSLPGIRDLLTPWRP